MLGTISDLHRLPVSYDLKSLRKIVADLAPDLLCVEITKATWEAGDLARATLEVREALAPVVSVTDTVLVPVAPAAELFADFAPAAGWQRAAVEAIGHVLRWGQLKADKAESINGPLFGAFCHTVCTLTELFWSSDARLTWQSQNMHMADAIIQAVSQNKGSRVLVAVQCQRLHGLVPLLRARGDLFSFVAYQNL